MSISPINDPARLAELAAAALLDTPDEVAFDRLTKLASQVLKCPVALVSLVDQDRQFFKSQVGLPAPVAEKRQTPLTYSFCQYVVNSSAPLIVSDARLHPVLSQNKAVTEIGVVAYLGMPLSTTEGHTLGSFCAIDLQPREWSEESIEVMRELSILVMREIELRKIALHFQSNWMALRAVERQRDELVEMLVHDLRNPMGSMLMALDVLRDPESPEEHAECLAIARKSGRSMMEMINDILDVSKSNEQGMRLEMDRINLAEIIHFAHEQLSHSANDAGIILTTRIAPDIPNIWADAEKLRRVLVNLVSNAIQHSEGGSVITSVEMGDGALILRVSDTGKGIPPGALERIFEKYGGVDSGAHGRTSSGLGLAFCKKVVEAHGGALSVQSELGKGATFQATISTSLSPSSSHARHN